MSLVPSLLQAIVRVDGEALVMHAGDKPYVVTPTGQVDLASRGLNLEAVNGIVDELLPAELQHALEEFGAVQYELPPVPEFPGEHFTVVVARGGDDVWTEIRRRRVPDDGRVPEEFFGPSSSAPVVQEVEAPPTLISIPEPEPIPFHDAVLQEAAPVVGVVAAPAPAHEPVPAVARHGRDRGRVDVARAFRSPATADTAAPAGDDDLMLPDEVQLFGGPAAPQPDAVAQAKSSRFRDDGAGRTTPPGCRRSSGVRTAAAAGGAEIDAPVPVPVLSPKLPRPRAPWWWSPRFLRPCCVAEVAPRPCGRRWWSPVPARPSPCRVPRRGSCRACAAPVVVAGFLRPCLAVPRRRSCRACAAAPVVVAEIPVPVPAPVPVAEVAAPHRRRWWSPTFPRRRPCPFEHPSPRRARCHRS